MQTALIVDNDNENLEMMHDMAAALGFDVELEQTAELVMDRIHQHRPDLLILDMALKADIDGLDITRAVRQDTTLADIFIVAVTADLFYYERDVVLATGCNAYLPKPFRLTDLRNAIGSSA
ncbi:MAG: response regulator [Chloroflexota bacterium]